ncbi:patatin-like phospholipase family protein [Clostridium sp. DL1XJH146]
MIKTGLVFSGGGGKGGYEIGVWKAMNELGIKAEVVSGSSIGALNGIFYTQGNLQKAISFWENIQSNDIIVISVNDIINKLSGCFLQKLFIKDKKNCYYDNRGLISEVGLKLIIKEYIDKETILKSDINFYVCVVNMISMQAEYFKLKDYDKGLMDEIILASCSIPGIFDEVEINGQKYYDGGLVDNTPIMPLIKEGCQRIIVVYLNNESKINKEEYKGKEIIEIIPSKNLGGFFSGTFDFTNKGSIRRINLGYKDAMFVLNKCINKF